MSLQNKVVSLTRKLLGSYYSCT